MTLLMRGLFRKLCISGNTLKVPIRNSISPCLLDSRLLFYSSIPPSPLAQEEVDPKEDEKLTEAVIDTVQNQVKLSTHGPLFAIVQVAGKQFKVTEGDVVIIEGSWAPTSGDKINLNKILLLGSADFTLVGRPLIQPGLVDVQATVIEKTLSHTKTHFKKKRRKQYKRINFYRIHQTYLRINSINILGELNNPQDVISVDRR